MERLCERSFYSILVRLKGWDCGNMASIKRLFLFHTGSIKSEYSEEGHPVDLLVSIPYWFD